MRPRAGSTEARLHHWTVVVHFRPVHTGNEALVAGEPRQAHRRVLCHAGADKASRRQVRSAAPKSAASFPPNKSIRATRSCPKSPTSTGPRPFFRSLLGRRARAWLRVFVTDQAQRQMTHNAAQLLSFCEQREMFRPTPKTDSTIKPPPMAVLSSISSPIIKLAATSAMIGSKLSTIDVNVLPIRLML